MKQLTIQQKVLYCYPYVYTKCIHKLVGTNRQYVYQILKTAGLPTVAPTPTTRKLPRYNKWNNI